MTSCYSLDSIVGLSSLNERNPILIQSRLTSKTHEKRWVKDKIRNWLVMKCRSALVNKPRGSIIQILRPIHSLLEQVLSDSWYALVCEWVCSKLLWVCISKGLGSLRLVYAWEHFWAHLNKYAWIIIHEHIDKETNTFFLYASLENFKKIY